MTGDGAAGTHLQRELRPRQFFTLAFGAIIGVGWVVVLGDWLELAGPVGAMLGFGLGGAVMMLIGLCYAELVTTLPVAGGEVVYGYEVFGLRTSFVLGWFLAFVYIAVTAFEAISFAWVLDVLFPGTQGPVLYTLLGEPVSVGALVLGVGGMLFFTALNYRGARSLARFQDFLTFGLVAAALLFVVAAVGWGEPGNLLPLFREGGERPAWTGVLWVFVTAPFWFSGFQVIPQVMEERAEGTSLRLVGKVILLSIGTALLFYWLVILASSIATPWESILDAELPVEAAMRAAFASPLLAKVVLFAAVLGILTTWNAVFVIGARLLFALARARMIPPVLGRIHPEHGSPAAAVLVVGAVGTAAVFLGRNAIVPIANIGATCFALAFLVSCWGVVKLRREQPERERPYRLPGGSATAVGAVLVSLFILVWSLWEPFDAAGRTVPLEWVLLIAWGALGVAFWFGAARLRSSVSEEERRRSILGAFGAETEAPAPGATAEAAGPPGA